MLTQGLAQYVHPSGLDISSEFPFLLVIQINKGLSLLHQKNKAT
jgi:hypothetical protein